MNNKQQALIIFSPAFAKDESDSFWLPWLQSLVKAFNKNYPHIKIIVFAFQFPNSTKQYSWHNNIIIPFNGDARRKWKRLAMWRSVFSELKKMNTQYEIMGVLSLWCNECTLLAKYFSRYFKLKQYCWVLGQDARPGNKMIKWIRPQNAQIIAMSDFLADQLQANYNITPTHIIINAVDTSRFSQEIFSRNIDIIGVGSLTTLKQYNIFVEVVAAIKKQFPGVRAVLCGDGPEAEHIRNMIKDSGVSENIEMKGTVEYNEGLRLMQQSKILLHPSSYEGFSSVGLEALYAGAHVISFIQPMHHNIQHWHVVQTKQQMIETAVTILLNAATEYKTVLVKTFDEVSADIYTLYAE